MCNHVNDLNLEKTEIRKEKKNEGIKMEHHVLILVWNILVCISTAFTSNISSMFAPPAVEGSSPDASWVIVVILAVFLLAIIIPTGICLGRRRWRAGKNMTTTTKTSK